MTVMAGLSAPEAVRAVPWATLYFYISSSSRIFERWVFTVSAPSNLRGVFPVPQENEPYFRFYECTFINCRITECQLLHCTFTDCEFQDCAITSLTTKYSTLKNARFINCSLVGVHWGGLQSRYCPAIAHLSNCRMKYNSFVEMNLTKSDFSKMELIDSLFEGCSLRQTTFFQSRLDDTQFLNCDLRQADFREAIGYKVDITTCRMKAAKFSFPEAIRLLGVLEVEIT